MGAALFTLSPSIFKSSPSLANAIRRGELGVNTGTVVTTLGEVNKISHQGSSDLNDAIVLYHRAANSDAKQGALQLIAAILERDANKLAAIVAQTGGTFMATRRFAPHEIFLASLRQTFHRTLSRFIGENGKTVAGGTASGQGPSGGKKLKEEIEKLVGAYFEEVSLLFGAPANPDTVETVVAQAIRFYKRVLKKIKNLDDRMIKTLGFARREKLAKRALVHVMDISGVNFNNTSLRDIPPYFSAKALADIAANLESFVPDRAITHGSTSAGLPGVAREKGLVPLGELITRDDGPCFAFSGEKYVYFLFPQQGVNVNRISVMPTGRRPSGVLDLTNNGNADLHYAYNAGGWSPVKGRREFLNLKGRQKHMILEERIEDVQGKTKIHQFFERQMRAWNSLSTQEKEMVQEGFPVIYQARFFDASKLAPVVSIVKGEQGYLGSLLFREQITEIFVPRDKITMVQSYLVGQGVSSIKVLPLDALQTARFLYSPTIFEDFKDHRFFFKPPTKK